MRTLLTAGALSLMFTLFLTPLFIRLFTRIGWGAFINADGPTTHQVKRGTPTMGGIVFVLGTVFAYFVAGWVGGDPPTISGMLVLFMMVGLGIVGFIDDFLKTHRRQSLGLGGWQKVAGQLIVAALFGWLSLQFANKQGVTPASTKISFIRDLPLDFLVFGTVVGVILFMFWILTLTTSTSNAVNLTDGLDGLAAGASILAFGSYVVIGFWQFNQSCWGTHVSAVDVYKCYPVRDPLDLAVVATAVVGGLIGFLWWNTNVAKIHMGDTGSLALGGGLAALAVLTQTELLLIVIGGLFVIETGSVIINRTYFKLTHGKRIFRASPLHHHFEIKGWPEILVVVRFWIVAGLFAAAGVGSFYFEWLAR